MTSELAWTSAPTPPPTSDDEAAVRATVLDYFEGWYDGDATRMARALHPQLAKRSWTQDLDRLPVLRTTTAEQMALFTALGNGREDDPDKRRLDIDIVEVSGSIATVVVHSYSYVEYLHLLATPDGWRIVNALWRYADGRGPSR
jgi:putative lumazine-binding protein